MKTINKISDIILIFCVTVLGFMYFVDPLDRFDSLQEITVIVEEPQVLCGETHEGEVWEQVRKKHLNAIIWSAQQDKEGTSMISFHNGTHRAVFTEWYVEEDNTTYEDHIRLDSDGGRT